MEKKRGTLKDNNTGRDVREGSTMLVPQRDQRGTVRKTWVEGGKKKRGQTKTRCGGGEGRKKKTKKKRNEKGGCNSIPKPKKNLVVFEKGGTSPDAKQTKPDLSKGEGRVVCEGILGNS